MEVSGQLHAPAALLPGKERRYPVERRLGGLQNWYGRSGKYKSPSMMRSIEHLVKLSVLLGYKNLLNMKVHLERNIVIDISSATGKVKVEFSLCFNQAPRHEGVLGSGGIAPLIL
jgi:hypothetical protein